MRESTVIRGVERVHLRDGGKREYSEKEGLREYM